jgi:uncharacterized membrane protein
MAWAHWLVLGFGGLLMAIPVVLHLMMRPKPKIFMFPAVRFVQQMERSSKRSLQLRHWLLLLLRCLLLLAVAAAFARPSVSTAAFGNWLGFGGGATLSVLTAILLAWILFVRRPVNVPLAGIVTAIFLILLSWTGYSGITALGKESPPLLGNRLAPVAAMVIVDSSPRMEYRFENRTLLQRAREEGASIISQLPPESRVGVVQNNGQPPFFSADAGAARKRMDTLETCYACTSLPEAIESAARFLRDVPLERKELYVISDLTRGGWATTTDSLKKFLDERPDFHLYLLDVGIAEPTNISLDQLTLSSGSLPENGTLSLSAMLRSVGKGGDMLVRMYLEKPDPSRPVRRDGKNLYPEEFWSRPVNVTVADNGTVPVTINMKELWPTGIHHGWLELESGDSLGVDNRQYFTIEVSPSWKALVAHPEGVDPGNLVYSLDTGDEQSDKLYDVTVINQRDIAQYSLEDYAAIFLVDPQPISESTWRILHQYVTNGGGLAIFLGRNASAGGNDSPAAIGLADGSFRSAEATSVLPGPLERTWRAPTGPGRKGVTLAVDQTTHPVTAPFRPWQSLGIWQPFPVFYHWEMAISADPRSQVLLRYSNGLPAVVEREIGNGKLVCMTTPITEPSSGAINAPRPWNALFSSSGGDEWPAWLLVRTIAQYLASGTRDRLNLIAGQTASLHNDRDLMPIEYRLFTPRDEEPQRLMASDNNVRYRFTDMPGIYRLKGQLAGPVTRGFSVNLPPGATDLQRLTGQELIAIVGEKNFRPARERNELQEQQGTARVGQEFYPVLALGMCLVLALELIMSNRFYKG